MIFKKHSRVNKYVITLIINNMPKHRYYYELCAGSAEIARRKDAAEKTILNG
jgi:hypothetical protein